MKVRAIAIATARTNVIGSVELATLPEGLRLVYIDAAQLGADGAPVAFERGTECTVPWGQVRDARLTGTALFLDLQLGPLHSHRLMLVRFSFGNDKSPHELRQRRLLLRAFAIATGLMTVMAMTFALPRMSPHLGPFFGLGLGITLAASITLAGIVADRWLVSGGQPSALVREIFVGELMSTLPRVPREPATPLSPVIRLPNLEGLLPRTTLAVTITLAGGLLAALVMAKWVFWGNRAEVHEASLSDLARSRPNADRERESDRAQDPPPEPPTAGLGSTSPDSSAAVVPPSSVPATPGGLVVRGPCSCSRADSPLWRDPLPRLTPLVLATRRFPHKNHEDVELELAVVNNSDRPLGNISALVEFFEADQSNVTRLTSVESRTVFFEGPLGAGKAIKWHVEERGTTFKIHPPTSNGLVIDEAIGPLGEGAASASAFAELLHANNRPVRLHAAMMLAYLGDRRARASTVELGEAMRDSESGYLRRLLEATSDQVPCQIELGTGNPRPLRACIFNAGTNPMPATTVTLNLLDAMLSHKDPVAPPPQIVAERSLSLAASVPPRSGILVEASLDWSELPAKPVSYEILVQAAAK